MLTRDRQRRALVLEALDQRTKQFRSRDGSWPFRMPHEPLDLDALVEDALAGEDGRVPLDALRTRTVLRMEWRPDGIWELWAIALPSGLHLYCDSNGDEARVLASVRRGNPSEADGFFLERLAESHGHLFGIEMTGTAPDRVRSSIGDRDFLADVLVELLEDSEAGLELMADAPDVARTDFRAVVVAWLDRVLTAPPMTRRQPRVRDEEPSL